PVCWRNDGVSGRAVRHGWRPPRTATGPRSFRCHSGASSPWKNGIGFAVRPVSCRPDRGYMDGGGRTGRRTVPGSGQADQSGTAGWRVARSVDLGVLDRLLEDDRLAISAISGTSAGAMNAVVLADGLERG